MQQPEPAALHNQPYTIVANSVIGEIPLSSPANVREVSGGRMPSLVSRGDAVHVCRMVVLILQHVKGDGHVVAHASTFQHKMVIIIIV